MKKVNNTFLIIIGIMLVVLAACSGGNTNVGKDNGKTDKTEETALDNLEESGMPIVKEPITLKMFTGMSNTTLKNWDDLMVWNHYEDQTNIKVEWEQIESESLEEQRNLRFVGGSLPDVFFAANIPTLDLLKYGEQGMFIPLNDLIEEYAPNLTALMEATPEIRKAMTFPDGNIYSLPSLFDPEFTSVRANPFPWFDEEVLKELDLEIPETVDDFYDFLVTVKEEGKDGQVPLGIPSIDYLAFWLKGAYNIGNTGRSYIDKDPDSGDLRFYTGSEEYKEMIAFISKLYEEELIEQNIFSLEWGQFLANAAEGRYASTVFYPPKYLFGDEVGSKYVPAVALEGPHGDQKWVQYGNPVTHIGKFAITNENEHPEATMRWIDYFYSDEGSKLWHMGIEGETFEIDEDGNYEYVDKILNSSEGLSKEQEMVKYLGWVGLGAPGILMEQYFGGSESAPESIEAAEKMEPYLIDETWPAFTYTEEEAKVLSSTGTDVEKYVDEMRDKFIAGEASLSEWDNYISELDKMGLEKYLDTQNAAYERYLED